jgi:hypothetical protein
MAILFRTQSEEHVADHNTNVVNHSTDHANKQYIPPPLMDPE